MILPVENWKNKNGTEERSCKCGSWKQHWLNFSGKRWPNKCSVKNCKNRPTLGGHIINPNVSGERIVPMCDSCNKLGGTFDLEGNITLVKASRKDTCGY